MNSFKCFKVVKWVGIIIRIFLMSNVIRLIFVVIDVIIQNSCSLIDLVEILPDIFMSMGKSPHGSEGRLESRPG